MNDINKDDRINAEIVDFGINGEGIGKCGGFTVFVDGAVPGDRVKVLLTNVKNRCAYGVIDSIIAPSDNREKPVCKSFGICGGCNYLHTKYDAEVEFKVKKVNDALKRIGGQNFKIEEAIKMEEPYFYRNKAVYHAAAVDEKAVLGFYAIKSHNITDTTDCVITPKDYSGIIDAICGYMAECKVFPYNYTNGKGHIKSVVIRQSASNGGILVCIVSASKKLPNKDSLVRRVLSAVPSGGKDASIIIFGSKSKQRDGGRLPNNFDILWGSGYITDNVKGLCFKISPASFYQVNSYMAEKVYDKVLSYAELTGSETVIDAYCGIGVMALLAAVNAKRVIGVEIDAQSVRDAKENAKTNGIKNARFINGDAGAVFSRLQNEVSHTSTVILDPPRAGCDKDALDGVIELAPKKIIYVSCDPATLARDVKVLASGGYAASRGACFDMFPKCAHIETVILLTKEEG